MRVIIKSSLLLIFFTTVTFYSCKEGERGYQNRAAKGDVRMGGTLRVAISEGVESYLPSQISSLISSEIGLHLHEGLVKLDPQTLKVIPGLAESWSVDDTGTNYVFTLRKGVQFHEDKCFGNGSREITARDFEYSYNQLCAENATKAFEVTFLNRVLGAKEFHSGETNSIAGIKVVDDYTLKIVLMKADPSFLFVLAQPSTAVVSERAFDTYSTKAAVGAGPFEFESSENKLVLVRNVDYYQKDAFDNRLPYFDTLIFVPIATKEAQLHAFFEGELDVVSGLYLDPVKQILEKHVADFSGKKPKYIMKRESESVGYESYSIYRASVKGFENNFMGYRDFSRVQIEQ